MRGERAWNGKEGGQASLSSEESALLTLLRGARRGLVVVGELVRPEEAVAASQLAAALGWPVAADVLSGLRVGAASAAASGGVGRPVVIHPMAHLLLGGGGGGGGGGGDHSWGACLKPDVVLQLGAHGTSKRLAQFLVGGGGD